MLIDVRVTVTAMMLFVMSPISCDEKLCNGKG